MEILSERSCFDPTSVDTETIKELMNLAKEMNISFLMLIKKITNEDN